MTSILKVDTIQDQSGNNIINENADTITIGASGDTISIPSGATIDASGATLTLPTTIEVDTIEPQSGTSLTLGASGDTITIPSGATITNSGTATGFGKVLQVVQASDSTQTDTSSATYTDIVTASITPSSASNKILFVAHANGLQSGTPGAFGRVRVSHSGGTTIVAGTAVNIGLGGATEVGVGSASISYLDTPATTSAVTYKIQFACPYTPGGVVRINVGSSMSTITLMEIAS